MKLPLNYDSLHSTKRRKVREEYVKIQKGLCAHCQMPLSGKASSSVTSKPVDRSLFPPNFFKWPIHLHHSHETGMTIGAIHSYCNAVLWQYHGE